MSDFETGSVTANGVDFHYKTCGSGPLALCLHGFPDSPYTYRYLMPALADAGFRAVAPFMRGYAPTGTAPDGDYNTWQLGADANALHAALGGDGDAVLIAHDWGSVAAFGALSGEPGNWSRAVIGNVPPLAVFGQIAFTYPQIKRSFYFWFFQMAVSEAIVSAENLAFIDGLWGDWSPGYDASDDLPKVKECLGNPDNLRAAMGYYRALFSAERFGTPEAMDEQGAAWGSPITQPTLYIHGTNDGCIALDATMAEQIPPLLGPGSRVERPEGLGHFFLVEAPERVNPMIVEFLKG